MEGLDIAEDGIELPPPPAPEEDAEVDTAKPNLLVRGGQEERREEIDRRGRGGAQNKQRVFSRKISARNEEIGGEGSVVWIHCTITFLCDGGDI